MPADLTLKTERAALATSVGYLTYVVVITTELDKDGHNVLKHFYQRHHLNWEDAGETVHQLAKEVKRDYTTWLDSQADG